MTNKKTTFDYQLEKKYIYLFDMHLAFKQKKILHLHPCAYHNKIFMYMNKCLSQFYVNFIVGRWVIHPKQPDRSIGHSATIYQYDQHSVQVDILKIHKLVPVNFFRHALSFRQSCSNRKRSHIIGFFDERTKHLGYMSVFMLWWWAALTCVHKIEKRHERMPAHWTK